MSKENGYDASPFDEFLRKVHKSKPRPGGTFGGTLLALDPGETTGWSIWSSFSISQADNLYNYNMESCGQLDTWNKETSSIDHCVKNFPSLIEAAFPSLGRTYLGKPEPEEVVMESYRVYEWKADSHSWSDVPTLRIIGSMETRLIDLGIPYTFQTAQVAKNFVTDTLLKQWGFYERGQRHSRDSMRHALYYLLFGKSPSDQ